MSWTKPRVGGNEFLIEFVIESADSLGQEDTISAVRAAARAAQKEISTTTTARPHEPPRSNAP